MTNDEREIEVGDRFIDRDKRNAGRVVQVIDRVGRTARVVVEVHPLNPEAVGRETRVSVQTLRSHYRRQSR